MAASIKQVIRIERKCNKKTCDKLIIKFRAPSP